MGQQRRCIAATVQKCSASDQFCRHQAAGLFLLGAAAVGVDSGAAKPKQQQLSSQAAASPGGQQCVTRRPAVADSIPCSLAEGLSAQQRGGTRAAAGRRRCCTTVARSVQQPASSDPSNTATGRRLARTLEQQRQAAMSPPPQQLARPNPATAGMQGPNPSSSRQARSQQQQFDGAGLRAWARAACCG